MRKTITERQLSRAFEATLANGAWSSKYPPLRQVLREMHCQQGQPDLVGTVTSVSAIPAKIRARLALALRRPSGRDYSRFFANRRHVPRSSRFASGLSREIVRRTLSELKKLRLVIPRGENRYLCAPALRRYSHQELWAFEVKVEHWQRAFYQALQYRAFADRAAIVLAMPLAHRAEKHVARFRLFGIGIIAVDPYTGAMRTLARPRKQHPLSRFHQLYALGQFLNRRTAPIPKNPATSRIRGPLSGPQLSNEVSDI